MEKALDILKEIRNIENEYDHLKKHRFDKAISELEEAMKPKTCKDCKLYYIASNKKSCPIIQGYSFTYPKMPFSCSCFEPKDNA